MLDFYSAAFYDVNPLEKLSKLNVKVFVVLSFQRDFAVGICNKISEMIQGMYASFTTGN